MGYFVEVGFLTYTFGLLVIISTPSYLKNENIVQCLVYTTTDSF